VSVGRIIGNIIAIIVCGVLLFIEMWSVVPGPTIPTLVLAVGVPEVAPLGIVFSLIVLALAQVLARGWARVLSTSFAALALGCAIAPLYFLPTTIAASERAMTQALGPDYAFAGSDRARALLRPKPFDLATSFGGFPTVAPGPTRMNLPVRLRDGSALALDLYAPRTTGAHPTVILVYGGAWIFGKRADVAARARAFAAIGYTAAVIDYRHAPRYRFPTQIDDVQDAIATLAHNARAWDIDPTRVAIVGYSAGAELALLAAYEPGPVTIKSVVAYYAPEDLVLGYRDPPVPDPSDVQRILRTYIGTPPEGNFPAYRDGSPITHVRPGLPPTLLIGGARDELVRLSLQHLMRDALHMHGVRVASLDFPWSNHAFDEVANGTAGQLSRYYTERFFAATL